MAPPIKNLNHCGEILRREEPGQIVEKLCCNLFTEKVVWKQEMALCNRRTSTFSYLNQSLFYLNLVGVTALVGWTFRKEPRTACLLALPVLHRGVTNKILGTPFYSLYDPLWMRKKNLERAETLSSQINSVENESNLIKIDLYQKYLILIAYVAKKIERAGDQRADCIDSLLNDSSISDEDKEFLKFIVLPLMGHLEPFELPTNEFFENYLNYHGENIKNIQERAFQGAFETEDLKISTIKALELGLDVLAEKFQNAGADVPQATQDEAKLLSEIRGNCDKPRELVEIFKEAVEKNCSTSLFYSFTEHGFEFDRDLLIFVAENGTKTLIEMILNAYELPNDSLTIAYIHAKLKNQHDIAEALKVKMEGEVPESEAEFICAAARCGSLDLVETMILHDSTLVESKDHLGRTLLICAANTGNLEIVEYVLSNLPSGERFKKALNRRDRKGKTALFSAAERGYENVVDCLLERNANVAIEDICFQSPLVVASANNHAGVVAKLFPIPESFSKKDAKKLPIIEAARSGSLQAVQVLMDASRSTDIIFEIDQYQNNAFVESMRGGHLDLFVFFIEKINLGFLFKKVNVTYDVIEMAKYYKKGGILDYVIKNMR